MLILDSKWNGPVDYRDESMHYPSVLITQTLMEITNEMKGLVHSRTQVKLPREGCVMQGMLEHRLTVPQAR